jgi:RimJ/RimL family protein N-acetyltransferase
LRGHRPEDFDRFADIWADPAVVAEISGGPRSRSDSWDVFLRNAGHWQMTGFGQWAITEMATRQLIGQCGFFYRNRHLGDDFDVYPEAGWVLATEAQGKGMALEATRAAHDWFDRVMPGPLVCLMTVAHERSRKLAEALGYRALREAKLDGAAVLLMYRKGPP